MLSARADGVVVVGAGPAGLSCALALRSRGLTVTIIEALPRDHPKPGSRAIYIHGTTLRLLEHMSPGTGHAIAQKGLVWPTKRTCWRGRDVFVRTYAPPPAGTLPPFSSLPQSDIEQLLTDACVSAGVAFVWEARLVSVAPDSDGVRITDATGHVWECAYLVGADGARSAVRGAAGITMRGSRSQHSYVIADIGEDDENPRPLERVYHYEHPAAGGRNVLLVPFSGGWRVDLQCFKHDDPAALSGEHAAAWVGPVMGARYASRIRWLSTYRFLQLVAGAMTDETRRVLLIGEAAHLFPPFGARGMNSGIADADAAAAAISAALSARDPGMNAAAIGEFASSRHAAADRNLRAAAQALAATDSHSAWRLARRRIAGLAAPRSRRAAAWLDAAPYGPRLRRAGGADGGGY